jgi:hypothetical protein
MGRPVAIALYMVAMAAVIVRVDFVSSETDSGNG